MISTCRFAGFLLLAAISVVQTAAATTLQRQSFQALPGWAADDHAAALHSFRLSCREILKDGAAFGRPVEFGGAKSDWDGICSQAQQVKDARAFFETQFTPFRVIDAARPAGLFTGYYEPEAEGSRTADRSHTVPIYGKPADLVSFSKTQKQETGLDYGQLANGKPLPYLSRKEIEQGGLADRGLELVWLKDWADAFFIHVQGSGRVRLSDGSVMRLSYAAKSGRDYTGIGALLVERGAFSREDMSMQAIRQWLRSHPKEARELMWQNESFIFFRETELEDSSLGALGAQHVQLTPQRSLAVDRSIWMFGTPVWLDTEAPTGDQGSSAPLRQLLIAQDTGTAIRGYARGDVYWGFGEHAAAVAGRMKSPGTMVVLLPNTVATRLGLLR